MKNLIIVRHGDCSDDDLNVWGIMGMRDITQEIKKHISEGTFMIMASLAHRAKESAEVIGSVLGIKVGYLSEAFWSDKYHRQNNEKFLQELWDNAGDADNVILVSHKEYVKEIPMIITRNQGFASLAECFIRSTGTGVLIDMVNKRFTELKPEPKNS